MGTWGVAVFSDDLAADVRDEFRDLIGEGLSSTLAVEKLLAMYASSLNDDDVSSVFWISLALSQWRLGRLEERTKHEALRAIESGQDLNRWETPRDRKKRAAVLEKLHTRLLSTEPPPKRVPRKINAANVWQVGEVVGLRLQSENWTLIRVIGHHTDKGGRFAVCELLDWIGKELPPENAVSKLSIKLPPAPHTAVAQFMLGAARTKQDQVRLQRLGFISTPALKPGSFLVVAWPRLDRILEEWFGIVDRRHYDDRLYPSG